MVLMKVPTILRTEWLNAETMDKPMQAREALCLSHAYILILAVCPSLAQSESQCCQILCCIPSGDEYTIAGPRRIPILHRCASSVTVQPLCAWPYHGFWGTYSARLRSRLLRYMLAGCDGEKQSTGQRNRQTATAAIEALFHKQPSAAGLILLSS